MIIDMNLVWRKPSPQITLMFSVAFVCFVSGFLTAYANANLAALKTRTNLQITMAIHDADLTLEQWKENYVSSHFPHDIAIIALSPEKSWNLIEERRNLIAQFEKRLPLTHEETNFYSDNRFRVRATPWP